MATWQPAVQQRGGSLAVACDSDAFITSPSIPWRFTAGTTRQFKSPHLTRRRPRLDTVTATRTAPAPGGNENCCCIGRLVRLGGERLRISGPTWFYLTSMIQTTPPRAGSVRRLPMLLWEPRPLSVVAWASGGLRCAFARRASARPAVSRRCGG